MTEREKMLAGQLYDCGDPELLAQWHRAKNLVRDYNPTASDDLARKEAILTELLGGDVDRTYGLPRRFMLTMATIFLLATTAK